MKERECIEKGRIFCRCVITGYNFTQKGISGKMIVYIDMDDVLCDFSGAYAQLAKETGLFQPFRKKLDWARNRKS